MQESIVEKVEEAYQEKKKSIFVCSKIGYDILI